MFPKKRKRIIKMSVLKKCHHVMHSILFVFPVILVLEGCMTSTVKPTVEDLVLANRAEQAKEKARNTPAKEYANVLNMPDSDQAKALKMIKGETPATEKEMDWARSCILQHCRQMEKGPDWPRPVSFSIPFATEIPKMLAEKDDPAWQKALVFNEVYPFNQKEAVPKPATTWLLLWDEQYFYARFECADEDIEAPAYKRDEAVFANDCVEIFILPEFRLGVYWELVVSPAGCIYDGLNGKRFEEFASVTRADENIKGLKVACSVKGTVNQQGDKDEGYIVDIAIPFNELPTYTRGNKPQPGDRLWLMLVRLDNTAGKQKTYSFKPLLLWGHNIWNHYQAELVK